MYTYQNISINYRSKQAKFLYLYKQIEFIEKGRYLYVFMCIITINYFLTNFVGLISNSKTKITF